MVRTITKSEQAFHVFNYAFLTFVTLLSVLPFVHIIALSFSSYRSVLSGEVGLLPVEATVNAYRNLIIDGNIFVGLRNTIVVTVVGTTFNMVATTMAAYPLSKQRLRGRGFFLWIVIFTMLFNGGIIPTFVLIRQLGLLNTYWALWLLVLVSPFNMFVMKSFFQAQPESLEESAVIDGANDIQILVRIILPLSMPVIATLTLFYAVGHWNTYMNVLIYISDPEKYTLMMRLRQMITGMTEAITTAQSSEGTEGSRLLEDLITPQSIRSAAIVVSTLPIMLIYPFLQRYFVKGVMLGSLKG
ncbi:MAG: carbohydrate ABC transporter permease [Spirochaetota bacterium]